MDEESVLFVVGHPVPIPSHIVELSQEGCRVRTLKEIGARSRLPVEVFFKVKETAFRFSGVVEWVNGGKLLGVRFVYTSPGLMVTLAEVIREIEAADAASAATVTKPTAAWKSEEEEPSPMGEDTAAAATGAKTLSAPSALPRDRRGGARQEVDNTATILLVNIGSTLRGRILDLSLGGCRIRTEERFPVGIYTRVETEFRAEGLPFRLGGVIQAIHDRYTVGIRFLDLSERKRQQVLELIEEIQKMHPAQTPTEPMPSEVKALADGR